MLHTSLRLILAAHPCDRVEHVRTWLGPRSADELFPLPDLLTVPGLDNPSDLFWALAAVPPAEVADRDRIARIFACDCAERALNREREKGREPHPDLWRAIDVARRYAVGTASESERAAAWDAARDAAWDAAWGAARGAARKFQADELEGRILAIFGEAAL